MRTQTYRVKSGADLGRVLRDARTGRGLTQQQLVDQFGLNVDRSRLARIEAGEGFQSLDRALSILRRLGVEVSLRYLQQLKKREFEATRGLARLRAGGDPRRFETMEPSLPLRNNDGG